MLDGGDIVAECEGDFNDAVDTIHPSAFDYCDGVDNNCDSETDERNICPDATVANTVQFSGQWHVVGAAGHCASGMSVPVWPTLGTRSSTGQSCTVDGYAFDLSTGTLYYGDYGVGISDISGNVQPTPPCNETVRSRFMFDASGQMHYQCGNRSVYRGDGELVVPAATDIAAVLDDGRLVFTEDSDVPLDSDYVVVDATGTEVARLSARDDFSAGRLTAIPSASTVQQDSAFVAYTREGTLVDPEIVIYRLDGSNNWSLVR